MPDRPVPTVQRLFDLTGHTALVTGASGHLGFALASALAEAGGRVIVASRKLKTARDTAAALPGIPAAKHFGVALNHMDEASLERGFAQAVRQAGRIDILVNNAHEGLGADWRSVTGPQFTQQLANATGYFLLARLLRDHAVAEKRSASIIMLGSMYGQVASYPDAYEGICAASPAAYHALKGGIVHLTRHLAVYWAKDRVRVNCLSPGPFPGPAAAPKMIKRLRDRSPTGRMGERHELKGAVVFLASEASSYVTGHNLVVDGGWTAW
jgi:gluconate 5-dehydrogenase